MSYETVRISELAKELGLPSKEVVEKFAKIGVTNKTHSSTVTMEQIARLKDFIANGGVKKTTKPKAFVVKKAKPTPAPVEEKKEEKPTKETSMHKVEKVVRPKVEVVKPVSRLEIVRRAPRKAPVEKSDSTSTPTPTRKPYNNGERKYTRGERPQNGERKFPPKGERPQRPVQNGENKDFAGKKPLQRRIIPQDIYENKGPVKRKSDGKKKEKDFNSKKEEQERISLEKAAAQHHKKKVQRVEEVEEVKQIVVTQPMTISELSEKIKKTPAEIVKFLMLNGVMATVNQLIDVDVIKKVCAEYGLEVLEEDLDAYIEQELEKEEQAKALTEVDKKLLKRRAPVISIMGHVDHGKTTLLDSIRASKHKIVASEVGGITQSIGAYTVYLGDKNEKKIVFLDTPGHEAFTEMRARGAKATDIAILVVAADDGIMPQTIEAINHAKAAEIPIIVAVNKIDKPGANPDRVLQQLTEHGLVPEAWGGDTITVNVSALQGTGIDELLEYILLVADVQDLKANPKAEASGVVIEANLDKGKGPVATLLVQNGTLRAGNCIVVGTACGRVRALLSDSGERIQKAEPSTPVEILGLSEVPQAGDHFEVVKNEKEMKAIVADRKEKERDKRLENMLPAHIRRESVAGDDDIPHLNLIIKANTHGSAEAVAQAIAGVESKEITTKIIHVGVGDISEADVMLAAASNALILGFTVKEDGNALASAEREGVTIKKYDIIYQLLEDIEKTLLSLLEPEVKEVELGKAEVRQVFTIGKTNKIAGCYVTEGKIVRSKDAVLYRDGQEIFRGAIDQLKRFKDDVKEVAQGFECGISFSKFNDIQIGDIIEVSTKEEVERKSL
ncbi:TPA: translation initiation factor IF-2 [Candidatus Gastranaerophilales bacterium HUM_6]|jgi:translation initiation factor IF-2|nr:translation initiation factor IF-2 [Fusobacterium sp. CAG:815]DAA91903.1 MAG TPA: translation initiation factor IF-2 [Candidatus Gastranaerophilales bacterium HUM_6]DAA92390.1 MAG TPA: translation initiation factor IF-2 [Candidatus Gastranaerophilales bacterium HUM_7]DAA99697.1 MAG TPA: translation initiation factor IF-2 [Candidatus Gastranaerophilales bacterium HUM_12]DAB08950.1 MAG TPA: translation initiation factor IF-2 [Candidatus Gastranaerophilales bacterium HUM_14]